MAKIITNSFKQNLKTYNRIAKASIEIISAVNEGKPLNPSKKEMLKNTDDFVKNMWDAYLKDLAINTKAWIKKPKK